MANQAIRNLTISDIVKLSTAVDLLPPPAMQSNTIDENKMRCYMVE